MKIGIDARWIYPEISGIGSYTTELIRHLFNIDRENRYVLFFNNCETMTRIMALPEIQHAPNVRGRLLGYSVFSPRGQWLMPWLLHYMRIEVFHSTNYMIPLRAFPRHTQGPVKCVVTIHDLIPLIYPQHTPRAMKTRLYPLFKWLMRQVGARADVIITPSSASRADVIKYMHIPAQQHEKVLAIPEGVDARYVPAKKKPADHRTVLYVGRLDPYKNVVNLIEAFSLVHAQLPNVRLQIVGPDDPRYPEARRRSAERGLDPWIDRTGYADAATLLEAYQQADVLALPSRYEGFGLPVLEAMACGTPVVCSRTASLPEVAGDAACLIDPDDVQGLADALIQTLSDPEYADRLKKRGLQRAQHFTWESTARKTLAAYTA